MCVMEQESKKVIDVLNELIETNLDRIKGYETAAGHTHDSEFKSLCGEFISQSRNFKTDLEKLVKEMGGEPKTSSSASGAVYRAWMNIKSTVQGDDKKAIYGLCEFGEDAAKNAYEDAVKKAASFNENVKSVINTQRDLIIKSHDRIHELRDSFVEEHH